VFDQRLQWNPDDYNGIREVQISHKKLYIPSVFAGTNFSNLDPNNYDKSSKVVVW
jgi:hypothetical protein